MFHILLHEPEIPPNTGNIIRLCANTGCFLHLIEPLGFDLDQRSVRRAGLDYASLAQVRTHATLADCLSALTSAPPTTAAAVEHLWAIETGAPRPYSEARFEPGDLLLFGAETRGLPAQVLSGLPRERRLSIPMRDGNRSLNLANAVAVVVYEAWRQQGYR
jgi:tRNA (cytidine/uridine-2'-O-)-methyltransferase